MFVLARRLEVGEEGVAVHGMHLPKQSVPANWWFLQNNKIWAWALTAHQCHHPVARCTVPGTNMASRRNSGHQHAPSEFPVPSAI